MNEARRTGGQVHLDDAVAGELRSAIDAEDSHRRSLLHEREEACWRERVSRAGRGSAGDAFERGAGGGVEFAGHAAGEERLAAGEDGMLHGLGHEDGILGLGDGGVHQDGVEAEFHGEGGVGGGADAGVDDQRDFGDEFAQDAEVGGVLHAEAAADGSAERHDGGGAGVDQALGEDDVVRGVGQNGEAFLDQDAGGFERGLDVGVERRLVADDFDLDPVGEADFAAEAGGADGFVGGVAAGGVGQQEVTFWDR